MQSPFEGKQPIGVIYNTTMDRPDAVLALALLYGLQSRRDSRMGAVSINGSGLSAAIFCDVVSRFYTPGPVRNANQVLLPGLALDRPLPPGPPMFQSAIDRTEYARSVRKPADTSLPEAVIRNGVIFNREAVMILSAPATYLAKSLDLQGVKEIYRERVQRLVIVDTQQPDIPAIRRVLAEFPAPAVFCPRAVGEAILFPYAALDKDFSWAPHHPIVDALKAYKQGPYDTPTYDMAAALFAVHPDQGYFGLSADGTIEVADNGSLGFKPGAGKMKSLLFDPAQKDRLLQSYVELASAKPPAPQQRRKRPA
ncbi:MAG: hypothetical protein KGN84_11885 [Acidobacteriota bacterium]|nr:hypothetical protein [Acidobacteriota bacterium]